MPARFQVQQRLLRLIRKTPDAGYALSQRFKERVTPAERNKGSGLLIDLFVGLRKETHLLLIPAAIFVNRDSKFERPVALLFFYRIKMKLSELFGWF
jgi:hypothetical protein